MTENSNFVRDMKLTQRELDVVDRYVGIIEQATKNKLDFIGGGTVAWTPGALLVVAVAKFAYDVYQDYGKVAVSREEFQSHFKSIAKELSALEAAGEDSLSLDTFSRLRNDLLLSKKDLLSPKFRGGAERIE